MSDEVYFITAIRRVGEDEIDNIPDDELSDNWQPANNYSLMYVTAHSLQSLLNRLEDKGTPVALAAAMAIEGMMYLMSETWRAVDDGLIPADDIIGGRVTYAYEDE